MLLLFSCAQQNNETKRGGVLIKIPRRGQRRDTGRRTGRGSVGQKNRNSFRFCRSVKVRRRNGWGPAGSFDIEFSFKTSGPLGDFFPGSESVFDITGTGLVADDFRSASTGSDSQIAAFHLNTTGNGQSGKYGATIVTNPEPATFAVWSFLTITGACWWRRRRAT